MNRARAKLQGMAGLALLILGLAASTVPALEVSDAAVERRIGFLKRQLLDVQERNGSWEHSRYDVGCTALCLLALKQAGLPNDHPAVRRAVQFILENHDRMVYSEALVATALENVNPKRYALRIKRAYGFLEVSQQRNGAWSYNTGQSRVDNSNTQFAVLGVAAAKRCDVLVDQRLERRAVQYWLKNQNRDGSWGYTPGANDGMMTMTLAGLASLHLLEEELERKPETCGKYEYHQQMFAALRWAAEKMRRGNPAQVMSAGPGFGRVYYGLYALERVAMFLAIKDIGGVDWYRWGAEWILGQDASALKVHDQAFMLLFLAKGKAPIAIAKWHWQGDWNNQHKDAENWCRHASKELDQKLDWIPARLTRLDSPAAKASMIFVNGRTPFAATPEEVEFLRAFLEEGGTLVAEIGCDETSFVRGLQETLKKELYPDLNPRFVPITKDHPVTWIKHKLSLRDVAGLEFRAGCKRLNVLILMRNISGPLNGDLDVQRDLDRAHKVATNIVAWSLQSRQAGKKLDEARLDEPPEEIALTPDQIKRLQARESNEFRHPFGRLKHSGNWYAAPRYFATLEKVLELKEGLPHFDGEVYVNPFRNDLFQSAVIFVTGYDDPRLKRGAVVNLRTYVQNGGVIIATSACTSKEFDLGFRKLIRDAFPNDQFEKIPVSDPIYQQPFDLTETKPQGTKAYHQTLKNEWGPLYGIRRAGRWVVIYSPVDFCTDISEGLHDSVVGYRKKSAATLSVNLFYNAMLP